RQAMRRNLIFPHMKRRSTRFAKETHAARSYPTIHQLHRTVGKTGFFLTTRTVRRVGGGGPIRASRNNSRLSDQYSAGSFDTQRTEMIPNFVASLLRGVSVTR
ncbi:MAG: hypothetical protein WCF35_02995, partial [Pseudolabrys sp.]